MVHVHVVSVHGVLTYHATLDSCMCYSALYFPVPHAFGVR